MDGFPTKIADFLESTAQKIRSMTVDRVRRAARWAALGLVLGVLSLLLVVFLGIGVFRLLGELIGVGAAYAAIGGLFVAGGALLWSKRVPKSAKETSDND